MRVRKAYHLGFVLAELALNRNVEISQLTELRGQLLELWKQDYLTLDDYPPASHVRLLLEIGNEKETEVLHDGEAASFDQELQNLADVMAMEEPEASGQTIYPRTTCFHDACQWLSG